MSDYSEFFLNSKASVIQLDLLEVSHPSFSQVYRIVRNAPDGVTVTLEDSSTATFEYRPVRIVSAGSRADLDVGFRIDVGDLGEVFPAEMDAVAGDDTFHIIPKVVYRTYRSDDLAAPLYGPIELEADEFSSKAEGTSFLARAPRLNDTATGELYKLDRFPMLRGFV